MTEEHRWIRTRTLVFHIYEVQAQARIEVMLRAASLFGEDRCNEWKCGIKGDSGALVIFYFKNGLVVIQVSSVILIY